MVDGVDVDDNTIWAILDAFTDADELLATQVAILQNVLSEMQEETYKGTLIRKGSMADAARFGELPIQPTSFEQSETEDDVTIGVGRKKDTVNVEVKHSALWYEVGSQDNEYSRYQYYVDNSAILDNPQVEPLGLYNDPYAFPQPLLVRDTISVSIERTDEAPGPADYFSKVRYVPIRDTTADALENIWKGV